MSPRQAPGWVANLLLLAIFVVVAGVVWALVAKL
jgi:hypothetical protein